MGAQPATSSDKAPTAYCHKCGRQSSVCKCPDHVKHENARTLVQDQPIPPATGAVWGHGVTAKQADGKKAASYKPPGLANNTPQAVMRSFHGHEMEREAKHWEGTGKQITSLRATAPVVSFHSGPTGRVVEEKARCREIGEHPNLRNPGPERYDVPPITPVCMVPKGWQKEPRFKNSLFGGESKDAIYEVFCHPLCPTYPYPEPTPQQKSSLSEGMELTDPVPAAPPQESTYAHSPREVYDEADRRNPIRTADLNAQYFKYKHKPTWGFGSSGIGFRFAKGTPFAKQPLIKPHTRLRGFRELREAIPERSEKDYQEALTKALADAANAATVAAAAPQEAAAAPPALPQAPSPGPSARSEPAGKRKSAGSGEEKPQDPPGNANTEAAAAAVSPSSPPAAPAPDLADAPPQEIVA